jgi:predicted kinase
MCGLTGAGKTTYARSLVDQGWLRLSIDEYIFARYGVFGVDFEEAQWIVYQTEAEKHVREQLVELLDLGRDVVVDLSFWNRTMRDEFKHIVESQGASWELVYIKVDPVILPGRLATRRERNDANAFPIEPEMLARFIAGFEAPEGEGETVIEIADRTC